MIDADQAPWPLFDRPRHIVEVIGGFADVLEDLIDVVAVGANHGLQAADQTARLFERDGVTAVLYEWNVSTTKPWMNALSPLLKPAFEWNHNWVMRNGGAGIAALLDCRLLASD